MGELEVVRDRVDLSEDGERADKVWTEFATQEFHPQVLCGQPDFLSHLEPGMWAPVVISLDPLPPYHLLQMDMGTLSDF